MSKNLVIIPTYNESENIEKIIQAVMNLETGFHVLIVDDNSPDGTATIVKQLQQTYPDRIKAYDQMDIVAHLIVVKHIMIFE